MKIPNYAKAIELRKSNKELDKKFNSLLDELKWEWLLFACENTPERSFNYAKELVIRNKY